MYLMRICHFGPVRKSEEFSISYTQMGNKVEAKGRWKSTASWSTEIWATIQNSRDSKRKVEKIKYKRGKSIRKCSNELKSTSVDVSHVTVYNYLRKLKKWKAFKRPRNQLLTKMQRKRRLHFAREHKHLTAEDWEKYIFSDASTKYLFHFPNRQDDVVWGSQPDEILEVSCVKSSAKVMVWGAMGVNGLSKLHIVPAGETMNANYYVTNILQKELKPGLKRQKTVEELTNESSFSARDTQSSFKMVRHLTLLLWHRNDVQIIYQTLFPKMNGLVIPPI